MRKMTRFNAQWFSVSYELILEFNMREQTKSAKSCGWVWTSAAHFVKVKIFNCFQMAAIFIFSSTEKSHNCLFHP